MPVTDSFWIDVSHDGLHAYQRIKGRDRFVVEAKAASQRAAWAEKWAKLQKREKALCTKEQKKESAAQQTERAVEALQNIENILITAFENPKVFKWDRLKDHSVFPKRVPVRMRVRGNSRCPER